MSWLHCAAEDLFATVFPSDCRLCGTPLVEISRLPVCSTCIAGLQPAKGPACAVCGENLSAFDLGLGAPAPRQSRFPGTGAAPSDPGVRCRLCTRIRQPYVQVVYFGDYQGHLRDLIHLLKYEKVLPAAKVLGRLLWEVVADDLAGQFGERAPLLIPVPLHLSRQRARGFNQAREISAALAECANKSITPSMSRWKLDPGVLMRTRRTETQTGMSTHQRRANVRGAFSVMHAERVRDRDILLVDDVMTTGATIAECARVLRRAGCRAVWVATVARVLKTSIPKAVSWGRDATEILGSDINSAGNEQRH